MFPKTANLVAEAGISENQREALKRFYHPETVGIVRKLYSSHQAMYRSLKKLCELKLLCNVGRLPSSRGRGEDVYSTWKVKNVLHEVQLSRVLRAWGLNMRRAPDVGRLRPDAELGRLCVEMDMDTEAWPQVKRRLSVYQDRPETVIFVTTSEARVKAMPEHCSFLADGLIVCTVEEALRGEGRDLGGEKIALQKVFQKVVQTAH